MSTTSLVNVPTPGMPPVVSLPTRHLACFGCGIAIPADSAAVRVSLGHRWESVPGDVTTQRAVAEWLVVGACSRCAGIRAQAAQLVEERRVLQRDLGGVAQERVEGALLALDVLGAPAPALRSASDVLQLVSLVHGAGIAFVVLQRPGVCSSSRWAHVTEEARAALRDGVARWMRARLARPAEPLGPPQDSALRGCIMCGVDRADVWEAIVASRRALGGSVSPGWMEPIEADLCGACADAVVAEGSIGRSAMLRSLFGHLGIERRNIAEVAEVYVVGFGAVAGAKPSSTPWAHVDAPALREDLHSVGIS